MQEEVRNHFRLVIQHGAQYAQPSGHAEADNIQGLAAWVAREYALANTLKAADLRYRKGKKGLRLVYEGFVPFLRRLYKTVRQREAIVAVTCFSDLPHGGDFLLMRGFNQQISRGGSVSAHPLLLFYWSVVLDLPEIVYLPPKSRVENEVRDRDFDVNVLLILMGVVCQKHLLSLRFVSEEY